MRNLKRNFSQFLNRLKIAVLLIYTLLLNRDLSSLVHFLETEIIWSHKKVCTYRAINRWDKHTSICYIRSFLFCLDGKNKKIKIILLQSEKCWCTLWMNSRKFVSRLWILFENMMWSHWYFVIFILVDIENNCKCHFLLINSKNTALCSVWGWDERIPRFKHRLTNSCKVLKVSLLVEYCELWIAFYPAEKSLLSTYLYLQGMIEYVT